MVSAINTDQSELWKLLMQNSQSANSSNTESTDSDSSVFSGLLKESTESESTETQLYELLSDITQNMGIPAGMFIEDASEVNTTSVSSTISNGSSGSSSASGSSSSYDVRDTNMDGIVSQDEIDAALGIQQDSQNSKLKQQLETAYGLNNSDIQESILSLVA